MELEISRLIKSLVYPNINAEYSKRKVKDSRNWDQKEADKLAGLHYGEYRYDLVININGREFKNYRDYITESFKDYYSRTPKLSKLDKNRLIADVKRFLNDFGDFDYYSQDQYESWSKDRLRSVQRFDKCDIKWSGEEMKVDMADLRFRMYPYYVFLEKELKVFLEYAVSIGGQAPITRKKTTGLYKDHSKNFSENVRFLEERLCPKYFDRNDVPAFYNMLNEVQDGSEKILFKGNGKELFELLSGIKDSGNLKNSNLANNIKSGLRFKNAKTGAEQDYAKLRFGSYVKTEDTYLYRVGKKLK